MSPDLADERRSNPDNLLIGFVAQLRRDTLRYLPAAILPAGFSIAVVAVFTRIFSAEDYGRYALVMAAAVIVASTAAGWIQQSVLRFLPRYREEGRGDEFLARLAALVGVVVLGSGVILTVGSLAGNQWLAEYHRFYLPAAGLVLGEILFLTFITTYQSLLRSNEYAAFRVAAYGLRLILALGFVYLVKRDIVGLIVGSVGAYAIVLPMMIARLHLPSFAVVRGSLDGRFLRMIAGYGLPMMGWALVSQILGTADRFVIGAFRSSGEVGVYAANYTLVTMALGLLSTPIVMAGHPIIMNVWEGNRDADITRVITMLSRYYVILVIPFVTAVAVYSSDVVELFLGPEFQQGRVIVPLVLVGVALWGLGMCGHKTLELLERTRPMLLMVCICTILNLGLNVALVPAYGYRAAAVAMLISYAAYPVMVWLSARSTIPWRLPMGTVWRTLVASGVMAIVMYAFRAVVGDVLPRPLVAAFGGGVGITVYAAALVLSGELRDELRATRKGRGTL
jgi:O-antigen/teichoic acid export membrane protein